MNYSEELSELIEEFQDIDDKMERLEMVFDLADEVNLLPTDQWTDATRVNGCQSEAHVKGGSIRFKCQLLCGCRFKISSRIDGDFDYGNTWLSRQRSCLV